MNPYDIEDQHDLTEYKATGTLYTHRASGAEIYHIACDDKENSFAFSFRTPPADNSGLPHILEHTVLCGSERFPIKDPFITLYKGSMHTFLNAYTAPDRTVYPASSVVEKDFFNLMMIYGDAVFFPLLRKEAFMQEGHHMERNEQGDIICSGVVYNEMKGSYSSHESLLGEYSFRELFPDTPFSYDSGGEPSAIPSLSYEQFRNFHKKYYHPSNCRIYLYGDIPAEKTLAFLDEHFLSRFQAMDIDTAPAEVERWKTPREKVFPAPQDENGGVSHSLNWLLDSHWQGETRVAMQVLSQILIGNAGSPIQMAVQQSGIGDDLSPVSGLDLDMGEMLYSLGIRGATRDNAEEFRSLIFGELEKLADQGIADEQIEGALRLVEFREREIRGGLPFGLRLMSRAFRTWSYDRSPLEGLELEKHLEAVRKKAFQKDYWSNLIRQMFLDNPHYTLISLYPDESFAQQQEEEEQKRNRQWLKEQSREALKQWEEDLAKLQKFQQEEDDPAVLASIPFLTRHEIPREVSKIPLNLSKRQSINWYSQPVFTNGVFYSDFGFQLSDFTQEELLWLPFFSHSLTEIGAGDWTYDKLAQQISLNLGGLNSMLICATPAEQQDPDSYLVLRIRMLEQQIPQAMDLLEKVMFHRHFHQPRRLKELLLEMRNDMRTSLIPNGSGYALTRAASGMSGAAILDELWYGVTQYRHLQTAVDQWESGGDKKIMDFLQSLGEKVFKRLDWAGFAAQEDQLKDYEDQWEEKIAQWQKLKPAGTVSLELDLPVKQSLEVSSTVCYSAVVMKGPSLNSESYCAQLIISHLLKAGFLWERVRMKGGAYGASAGVSGLEKYFFFTSYRDPRGSETFATFKESLSWLKENITERDIDLALIGLVGKDLKPLSPSQKASMSVKRNLYGISDEVRQINRDRLLKMTPEKIRQELDRILAAWDGKNPMVLMGNSDQIRKAGEDYPELAEQVDKLGI